MKKGNKRVNYVNHGLTNTPIYTCYDNMIRRCYNESYRCYHRYGGRGIMVCEEWLNNKKQFFDDMIGGRSKGMTLDRIDNNGNYCKENCHWVTHKDNCRNTILCRDIKGESVSFWSDKLGIKRSTLSARLNRGGMSLDKALTKGKIKNNGSAKPVASIDRYGNILETFNSASEAGRKLGLDSSGISRSIKNTSYTAGGYKRKYI